MNKIGFAILSFALLLTACEDPAANKARALTSNSTTASNSQAAPAPAKGENLAVTPDNSKVLFTGSKVTGKHEGGFNKFTGAIDLVNEKPTESNVTVDIETASVFTDTDGLTKHLQTGDFFEVEKYPKATFTSTQIVPAPEGGSKFMITGNLEMHGVTKAVTFPATIEVAPGQVTANAEFALNRKDFNVNYPGMPDDLIRDEVLLKLAVTAPRAAAHG